MHRVDPLHAGSSAVKTARGLIRRNLEAGVSPAAAVEVGSSEGAIWSEAFGHLAFGDDAIPTAKTTLFDLASLTKPIATTSLILGLEAAGALTLDALVASFFAEWRGTDREAATVRDLLEHASGLPARLVDTPPSTRREFEHDICTIPLAHPLRQAALYSDLGFILLAFLAADVASCALDEQFDQLWRRLAASSSLRAVGDEVLRFRVPPDLRSATAPTRPLAGDPRKGRTLAGEVHDDYAAALGGVAGHSGLFGNAGGVGLVARAVLRGARGDHTMPAPFSPAFVAQAVSPSTVPGSSRALGWDRMLTTSSCGTRMSHAAFGHVGFTGTSLWIDPVRDRYFVLLTNRAAGEGTLEQMRELRRSFHDALGDF